MTVPRLLPKNRCGTIRAGVHILIDYRPALRQRTGVGEYVHRLTEAMLPRLRDGERVTLFSSSWKDRLQATPTGAARLDLRIPVKILNLAWHRAEWPPVERLGVSPDVTWSLHPLLMPSRRAVRAVTIHDLFFLDRPEATTREVRRDYAPLTRAHVRRAELVIVNSEYTRGQAVHRLGIAADRTALCYPGVVKPVTTPIAPPDGPILHLGTVDPRKNVLPLIQGYRLLASRRPAVPALVFAGKMATPPTSLGRDDLTDDRIRFLGYVDDQEKARLLATASMLVVPSVDEGFGMPALEAMAHGLPVVAADRGALPEVLGDAGLLTDADSPEALAAAMARLLEDTELRLQLRHRGLERAGGFTWQRSATALLDAFRAACGRRERKG